MSEHSILGGAAAAVAKVANFVPVPSVEVKIKPTVKADIYKAAYFRDDSDYDSLLLALLNKVGMLRFQLSNLLDDIAV